MARTKYIRNTFNSSSTKKERLAFFIASSFFLLSTLMPKSIFWSKKLNKENRAQNVGTFWTNKKFWFIVPNIQMYWLMYRLKWNISAFSFRQKKAGSTIGGFYQFCRFSGAFESMSSTSSADTFSFTFFFLKNKFLGETVINKLVVLII